MIVTVASPIRRMLAAALVAALASSCMDQSALLPPQRAAETETAPRITPVQRASDREHGRLLAAFGGEYRALAARAIIEEVVARLGRAGEGEIGAYQVTILNSPVVNAFALPNGRLYVTRGLMALASDTAELASVLAHEIAHVTARHAVERAEQEAEYALVSQVVSQVLNDPAAGAKVTAGGRLSLARFSRQQELLADQISVRTISRAGYDPYGAGRFLNALGRSTALKAGSQSSGEKRLDMLSSHPSTPERIAAVTAQARQIGAPGLGEREAERWLAAIDGLAYGDDPRDGLVRDRRYVNGTLRIAFEAPDGFELESARDMVVGVTRDGAQALRFDSVSLKPEQTLASYLSAGWIEGVEPGPIETTSAGGMPVAVASGRGSDWNFRMAAIQANGRVYRFILAAKGQGDAERPMRAVLASFRALDAGDDALLKPLQIRTIAAGPEDTPAAMAGRMALQSRALDTFLVLNGLERNAKLVAGQRYKIVTD